MARSFFTDFFWKKSPTEQMAWIKRTVLTLHKTKMRSKAYGCLSFSADDAVNEVLEIIWSKPTDQYARGEDELDDEKYFQRCLKTYLKEKLRKALAIKRTFESLYYQQIDDVPVPPSSYIETRTPEDDIGAQEELKRAHERVLKVTAEDDPDSLMRRYAENMINYHEDDHDIAEKLGTTRETIRQMRLRLKDRLIAEILGTTPKVVHEVRRMKKKLEDCESAEKLGVTPEVVCEVRRMLKELGERLSRPSRRTAALCE